MQLKEEKIVDPICMNTLEICAPRALNIICTEGVRLQITASPQLSSPTSPSLRATQLQKPLAALGAAVSFLMTDPSFARLPFGYWSRVLAGQVNRRHYIFVVADSQVVGFAGWAVTTKDKAEAWLTQGKDVASADSETGDVIILNAWKATHRQAHRCLLDAVRRVVRSKEAIYYKRVGVNGRVRAVRLNVNQFVASHIISQASCSQTG